MLRVHGLVGLAGTALCAAGSAFADAPASSSPDQVRAIVSEMLSDAESRSSLLAGGDAGHDNRGFFIAGDGFRLNVGGLLQFRYVLNFRDDSVTNDEFQPGFQNRRTQVWFAGTVNKDWDFKVMGEFSDAGNDDESSSSGFGLRDAWVRYNFANGWKLKWGQFKLPLLREELVADQHQLAAGRSLTNEAYTQDRSQGIELSYKAEAWRLALAFSDGLNSKNTDWTGSDESATAFKVAGEADWAATGRFEYLFKGNWDMFDDFTGQKGGDFGFMLGVAAHYQQSPNHNFGLFAETDRNTFEYTVDLSLKGDSWSLFGAFIGRHDTLRSGGTSTDFDDFGAVVQASYRFTEKFEVFGRWDAIFLDSDRFPSSDDTDFHFLTAGINYYFAGHAAKWTTDVVWSFNKTSNLQSLGVLADTGVGLLGESKENEVTIRTQFQLVF